MLRGAHSCPAALLCSHGQENVRMWVCVAVAVYICMFAHALMVHALLLLHVLRMMCAQPIMHVCSHTC